LGRLYPPAESFLPYVIRAFEEGYVLATVLEVAE